MANNVDMVSVDRDFLLQLARDAGLSVVEQSAYYRLSHSDSPARVYVAKTQKVTRVDFAGFCPEADGVRAVSADEAKEQRLGKVRGQLDFGRDYDTVVAAFTAGCEQLKNVVPSSKVKKARKAPMQDVNVDSVVASVAVELDNQMEVE